MDESPKTLIGICQECGTAISQSHPYSWCTECGTRLPAHTNQQLDNLSSKAAVEAAARKAPPHDPVSDRWFIISRVAAVAGVAWVMYLQNSGLAGSIVMGVVVWVGLRVVGHYAFRRIRNPDQYK